ncbi:MAG TPA: alpha-hydroxy acid oxidase [Burkholderiales bacterium]|nr:alpha-hydroxy acid oxidase [Burkholderiales bacterium]
MRAFSIEELRLVAKRRLPRAVFDFIDGGAEDERTLRGNCLAFGNVRLSRRVLVDVSRIETETSILGKKAKLPIAIAPTGAVGFGWRGGDIAVAKAAADFGIPFSLSTSATASIERIAEEAPGRHWFQAYFFKEREFTFGLIERARKAGYDTVMVTADLPVGGKRERDFRNDFSIPFRFTPRNVLDFATRPAWALDMLLRGVPRLENLAGMADHPAYTRNLVSSVGRNQDTALDWEVIKRVRDAWPGKLLIKGVVHPGDAERAVAAGCDGVIVSNHGGRQLDGEIASFDALPGVARAIGGKASVLMDGGIRRGSDIVKALARGAEAVMIGRATFYGVCAGGEEGARRALEILSDELVRTMQLCGARSIGEIGPELLAG